MIAIFLLAEDARAQPVLDVVHVVGGRVGEVDDLGLEARALRARAELGRPVLVRLVLQQALAHLARQVEAGVVGRAALEPVDDAQDLRVVAKAAVGAPSACRAPAPATVVFAHLFQQAAGHAHGFAAALFLARLDGAFESAPRGAPISRDAVAFEVAAAE